MNFFPNLNEQRMITKEKFNIKNIFVIDCSIIAKDILILNHNNHWYRESQFVMLKVSCTYNALLNVNDTFFVLNEKFFLKGEKMK